MDYKVNLYGQANPRPLLLQGHSSLSNNKTTFRNRPDGYESYQPPREWLPVCRRSLVQADYPSTEGRYTAACNVLFYFDEFSLPLEIDSDLLYTPPDNENETLLAKTTFTINGFHPGNLSSDRCARRDQNPAQSSSPYNDRTASYALSYLRERYCPSEGPQLKETTPPKEEWNIRVSPSLSPRLMGL